MNDWGKEGLIKWYLIFILFHPLVLIDLSGSLYFLLFIYCISRSLSPLVSINCFCLLLMMKWLKATKLNKVNIITRHPKHFVNVIGCLMVFSAILEHCWLLTLLFSDAWKYFKHFLGSSFKGAIDICLGAWKIMEHFMI